jgi:hypothetical protein
MAKSTIFTQLPLHHWSRHFGSFAELGSKVFFHNLNFMGSKDAELYVDFQNTNLPKLQNAPKKVFPRKH